MKTSLKTITVSEAIEILKKGQKIEVVKHPCKQCKNNWFTVELSQDLVCVVQCTKCPTRVSLPRDTSIKVLP